MRELTIHLPESILERLENIAQDQHTPLEQVVQTVLSDFIEQEEDGIDPTLDEILGMIEESEQEIKEGRVKTLDQVLAEIRTELAQA